MFSEGAAEPHKDMPSAQLDMAQTKETLDWFNGPSRKTKIRRLDRLQLERLTDYWKERWTLFERIHCLISRFDWHWSQIPVKERSDLGLPKKDFLSESYNVRSGAIDSLRRIEKEIRSRNEIPPLVERKSVVTQEDLIALKKYLKSRRCASKAQCGTKCTCAKLWQYIAVSQVRLQGFLYRSFANAVTSTD